MKAAVQAVTGPVKKNNMEKRIVMRAMADVNTGLYGSLCQKIIW